MKTIKYLYFLVVVIVAFSCDVKDGLEDEKGRAVVLVLPENNKECVSGIDVNDTESTITFEWNSVENTTTYELFVTDLNDNTSGSIEVETNKVEVNLKKNTPYEWYVVAKSADKSEKSDRWKFYTQGQGTTNYAPFPATAVQPKSGAKVDSENVTLEWSASDVDGDIVEYDLIIGVDTKPTKVVGTTAETSVQVTAEVGQTYYWQIITRDSKGNTSYSQVFNFKV